MAAPNKAAKGSKLQVVTSNHLLTGDVVFMRPDETWGHDINEAEIADGNDAAVALLERASTKEHQAVVVDPYLCAVEIVEGDKPYPKHYREKMRITGPSHREYPGF